MPDWDADSPRLRENLTRVFEHITKIAEDRQTPSLEIARRWQALVMEGLDVPDVCYVGAFRGEPGLEDVQVRVGPNYGADAVKVASELAQFETKLQTLVGVLDNLIPPDAEHDEDQMLAVIDACAWVHAEWVRIHPFANGNGRTARLWANFLAIRYGLPPVIRLRPRPDGGCGDAGAKAMHGDWQSTATVFRQLLDDFLDDPP